MRNKFTYFNIHKVSEKNENFLFEVLQETATDIIQMFNTSIISVETPNWNTLLIESIGAKWYVIMSALTNVFNDKLNKAYLAQLSEIEDVVDIDILKLDLIRKQGVIFDMGFVDI